MKIFNNAHTYFVAPLLLLALYNWNEGRSALNKQENNVWNTKEVLAKKENHRKFAYGLLALG